MRSIIKIGVFTCLLLARIPSVFAQNGKYKCLIQMNSYMGDGAYIVVSLVNPSGQYEKTLYILGNDKRWFKTLKEWNKFYTKKPSNISAITGASVSGGDRAMKVLEIDESKLDKGYKLRFESAVEDQKYHQDDAEVPLTAASLAGKTDGTGYIKYVRFSKVK